MKRSLFLAMLALGAVGALAACGGDDDEDGGGDNGGGNEYTAEQQAAVDYVNSLANLYNSGDIEAFVAEFTDSGLAQFLQDPETPPDELRQQAGARLGARDVQIVEVVSVEAGESDATVNVVTATRNVLNDETFVLVRETPDNFQVDGYSAKTPEVPEGVTAVEVEAVDFAYNFEAPDNPNFALIMQNNGEQFHELVLLKVADEAPELDRLVDIALATEDPSNLPPELEEFVGVAFAAPGESAGIVFRSAPDTGRYMMICFVPDETQGENGPPHATLGMVSEFTTE